MGEHIDWTIEYQTHSSQTTKWTVGLGLEEGGGLDQGLQKVFGTHLHNQWDHILVDVEY